MFFPDFSGAHACFEQPLILAAHDCFGGWLLAHILLPLRFTPPAQPSGQFPVPFGVSPSSLFPLRRRGRRDSGNSSDRCHWALIRKSSPVPIDHPMQLALDSKRIPEGQRRTLVPPFTR